MTRLAITIAIATTCLIGCSSEESETPDQAIQSIMQLYEARDFDALIRTRYAEISKAVSEEQIQTLVDRFTTMFQDETKLSEALSIYASALEVAPELSEDGSVATFKLKNSFIKLSRMLNGKWGFHL